MSDLRARFASAMSNAEPDVLEGPARTGSTQRQATPRPAYRRGATEKQRNTIRDMIAERYPADRVEEEYNSYNFDTMTQDQISQVFRQLKAMDQLKARTQQAGPAQAPARTVDLPEGYFTIVFNDGSHRTLRVRRQDDHANFMPGRLLIGYLSGSENTGDYTNFAHVTERGVVSVWKKHRDNESLAEALGVLTGDPVACLKAYAQMSGNCGVCNRTLTTPESIEMGLGPVCADKIGL